MLNFINSESIYDRYGSKIGNSVTEKIEADSRLKEYNGFIFFLGHELEAIQKDYPEIKDILHEDDIHHIKEFIEITYETMDNGVYVDSLFIEEGLLIDTIETYFYLEEEVEKFMIDPAGTLETNYKNAIEYCTSFVIGQMLAKLKREGIEVDLELVKDVSEAL